MSKTVYKRRTKGAGGPSNFQTSGDGAESILSRALTCSRHCHQCKIGPCHTSRWDPVASSAIRPTSVIDEHKVEYEGRQQRRSWKKSESILGSNLWKTWYNFKPNFLWCYTINNKGRGVKVTGWHKHLALQKIKSLRWCRWELESLQPARTATRAQTSAVTFHLIFLRHQWPNWGKTSVLEQTPGLCCTLSSGSCPTWYHSFIYSQ